MGVYTYTVLFNLEDSLFFSFNLKIELVPEL